MQQNCKCLKCKKSICRHYASSSSSSHNPSRIPTLQNKYGANESAFSSTTSKCCCSSTTSKANVSFTKSEEKRRYCGANQNVENVKTLKIDLEETLRQIEERKQSKGCHCNKKSSNISTKIQKSGCVCGQKEFHFSNSSIPVSLTFKNPDAQSRKSVCSCKDIKSSDVLRSVTSSKQIVLPDVQIEICRDKIQTIQIDVKPTDLNSTTSGTITIPVQLRFRRCHDAEEIPPEIIYPPRTEKLLFEACTNKEYMENYMEPLVEEIEPVPEPIESEESEEEVSKTSDQFNKPVVCLCDKEDEPVQKPSKKKIPIIGLRQAPWREAMETENYIEPYLVEGYCASTDNVEVQTDLVLGERLLSDSLNSFPESKSKPEITHSYVCICGKKDVKASETIRWDLLFSAPPKKTTTQPYTAMEPLLVDFAVAKKMFTEPAALPTEILIPWTPPPAPGKKKKKKGISSCCGGAEEEPSWPEPPQPEPLPELVPLPEKIPFVYQSNCVSNEPYLNALSRAVTKELPPSPPSSKPKIEWQKFELPRKIKVRKVMKLKIEKKPIISASAPCFCNKSQDKPGGMSSLKSAESKKSDTSYVPVPCPHLEKMSSASVKSTKSLSTNQYQTKIMMDKAPTNQSPALNKDFLMKTNFMTYGPEGKMATKVTFKKDKEKSGGKDIKQNWKIDSKDISPINSKTVTCKYINRSLIPPDKSNSAMTQSCVPCQPKTTNIKPGSTANSCDCKKNERDAIGCTPDTCKIKNPQPSATNEYCPLCEKSSLKTDPVVAAFQACEAELKPVREALSTVKQKLRNLNMPELDCIFTNEEEDISNMCKCMKQSSTYNRNYSGYKQSASRNQSRDQLQGTMSRADRMSPNSCYCIGRNQSQRPMSTPGNEQSGRRQMSPSSCAANRTAYGPSDRTMQPSRTGSNQSRRGPESYAANRNSSGYGQSGRMSPPTSSRNQSGHRQMSPAYGPSDRIKTPSRTGAANRNTSGYGQSGRKTPPSGRRSKSPSTCTANRTAYGPPDRIMQPSGYGQSGRMTPPTSCACRSQSGHRQMSPSSSAANKTAYGPSDRMVSPYYNNGMWPQTSDSSGYGQLQMMSPGYSYNQSDSQQTDYDENYYTPEESNNHFCPAACNSSSGSSVPRNNYSIKTVLTVPAKRNKGIQKTGSMYRTNIRKRTCSAITNNTTDSDYTDSSATSFNPSAVATASQTRKCQKSTPKRFKSQVSFAKLTESMGPFLEAIRSILTVENTKIEKKGKQITCHSGVLANDKKVRVHMRIRPSQTSKKGKTHSCVPL